MAFYGFQERQTSVVSDRMGKIAVFEAGGKWFLFDVHSLNVFEVDEEIADEARDPIFWNRKEAEQDDSHGLWALLQEGELFTRDSHSDQNPLVDTPLAHVCLVVSTLCNLRCTYCFYGHETYSYDLGAIMKPEVGQQAIDFFIGNSNQSELTVSFFGGEPLIAFGTIRAVVEYANEIGSKHGRRFSYHLTTNGTRFTEQILEFLERHQFSIIISIDGPPGIQDRQRSRPDGQPSSELLEEWTKRLLSGPLRENTTARATYTRSSLDQLIEAVTYLEGLGFRDISIEPAYTDGSFDDSLTLKDLPAIEKSYLAFTRWLVRRVRQNDYNISVFHFRHFVRIIAQQVVQQTECGAGLGVVAVGPNGDIFPCDGVAGIEEHKMGTLSGGLYESCQETWRKGVNQKHPCKGCWAKYVCGGGCRAWAYVFGNRDINTPLPFNCEMIKLLFRYSCLLKSELPRLCN